MPSIGTSVLPDKALPDTYITVDGPSRILMFRMSVWWAGCWAALWTVFVIASVAIPSLVVATECSLCPQPDQIRSQGSPSPPPPPSCISDSDIDAAQDAWAIAAVAIGNAWNDENCTGALRQANLALDAAYTFDQPLLFRPTLASPANAFRRTRADVLSYFVGACAPNGTVGTDKGFALGFSVGDPNDQTTWQGFESVTFSNMTYATSGTFCDVALAQGTMSYVSRHTKATHVVDKTFVYLKNPTDGAHPLITAHHSSEQSP